jgi:5'(3')-deoxyribonucleotidase
MGSALDRDSEADMKFAIDLDGVVYEWQRTARYMLNQYRGHRLGPIKEWWTEWDSPKKHVTAQDWAWLWKEGVELGLFRYGHMTTGARVGMQELLRQGHTLSIVTHRPAQAVNDTIDWVSLYFKDIPLDGLHILSGEEPKTGVQADVLIDDKPENVIQWSEEGRIALLFDRPWNQGVKEHPTRLRRVSSWKVVAYIGADLEPARA